MHRISRAGALALCAGSLALAGLVTAGTAQAAGVHSAAQVTSPASVPATTSTMLPLLAAPLTLDVVSGPGGALTSITLSPTTVPATDAGLTATQVEPDRVRFINDAGTVRVDVSSRHGGQNVTARAGQLSDVSGPGSWSGDVFGDGTTSTVDFTIGELAGSPGTPDITGIGVTGAANVVSAVEHRTEEDEQQARVSIRFTSGIQTRTLTIRVQIGTHDGSSEAKVVISLSRTKGLSLPADQVVGKQMWTGLLCDGSTATIAYVVTDTGTIDSVVPMPDATVDQQSDKGISVQFSDHERVRIRVSTHEDGTMQVSVNEKIRCDSADPTVNVPVATSTPDDHGDSSEAGDDNGGDHQGTHNGSHDGSHDGSHGGSDDPSDDETSTSVSGSSASTSSTIDDNGGDDSSGPGSDSGSDSGSGSDDGASHHSGSNHG